MSEPERPYKRLSPLTPLVRSFLLVVAVLASTWDDLLRGDVGPIAWLLLALLVAGAVYGAASWLRTKYWIEADELRVDTGVVSRQSRRIRVDRLQGIDISQPFVARIFGLAELKMDVAGGGSRRGVAGVPAAPGGPGPAVRAAVPPRRGPGEERRATPATPGDAGPVAVAPSPDRVLLSLDPGMLVVSLLLSAEFGAFLVSTLVFAGLFAFFGQIVGGLAAAVPLLGGLAVTLFRKLSAYYRFTVAETSAGLQVRRGLFELDAQTIAVSRVQGVVVTEPLLWRRLGWAKVDVALAGYARGDGDGKPSASTVMPVAPRATAHVARAAAARGGRLAGPGRGGADPAAAAGPLGGPGAPPLPALGPGGAPRGQPRGHAEPPDPRRAVRPRAVPAGAPGPLAAPVRSGRPARRQPARTGAGPAEAPRRRRGAAAARPGERGGPPGAVRERVWTGLTG